MAKGHPAVFWDFPAVFWDFLVYGPSRQGRGDHSAWITLNEYRTTQRQIPDLPESG